MEKLNMLNKIFEKQFNLNIYFEKCTFSNSKTFTELHRNSNAFLFVESLFYFILFFILLGTYHVILDESHYKELLTHHVSPPPASSSSECSLIRMGKYLFCVILIYVLPKRALICVILK